jgi:hypothetical protein
MVALACNPSARAIKAQTSQDWGQSEIHSGALSQNVKKSIPKPEGIFFKIRLLFEYN